MSTWTNVPLDKLLKSAHWNRRAFDLCEALLQDLSTHEDPVILACEIHTDTPHILRFEVSVDSFIGLVYISIGKNKPNPHILRFSFTNPEAEEIPS